MPSSMESAKASRISFAVDRGVLLGGGADALGELAVNLAYLAQ